MSFYCAVARLARGDSKVNYGGAVFLGWLIRTALALPVVVVLVVLLWKLGKLADAYVEKLKAK